MELKDFITESLVQINLAIEESNEKLKDSTAIINPGKIQINSEESQAYGRESSKIIHQDKRVVQKVDFDVAVYAQNDKKAGGGAKISIASISIGGDGEIINSNKSESRLKFSIPVIYPEGQ